MISTFTVFNDLYVIVNQTLQKLCSDIAINVEVIDFLTTETICDSDAESFKADEVDLCELEETEKRLRVSSTRVTESVMTGDMFTVRALLGRNYRLVATEWNIEGNGEHEDNNMLSSNEIVSPHSS